MPFEYRKNVPLAPLTTFRVGGSAENFFEAETASQIESVFGSHDTEEVFVLGGGSNILIADEGIVGLVLKIGIGGVEFEETSGGLVRVTVGAGEDWDQFVGLCVERNLAGLECLSGIPGLIGGTPIQNVGAYGQDVSETIELVEVFDRKTLQTLKMTSEECGFEYRKSIFNSEQKDRFVVLSVTFVLRHGGAPKVEYRDLRKAFENETPSLSAVRQKVREIRRSKGMLVRQGGPDSQSAGSFFKNPVVENEQLGQIASALEIETSDIPYFDVGDGFFKVPAAWMIEKAGFKKGFRLGNAGLSEVHALALTNKGGATAREIIKLKETIEEGVYEKFGIKLVNEPNLIGF